MTSVFHRHTHHVPPTAVRGDGIEIIDSDGKRYIDASGGAAVSCLGHSHPRVIEAIKEQVDQIAFAHTGFFTSRPAEELADHLVAKSPEGLDAVYYVSGGSEAVEAALKLARQYHVERGENERRQIIARWQSYHDNTLGALAVGGNRWRREPFAPMLIESHHISPCFAYRFRRDDEDEEAYGLRMADELEAKIQELGPDTVAAFIAEPVVGATAGAVAATPGYFRRIREICDRHGVLLILDEVMCGMGRTGTLFACEQDGIAPDLACIAKGLGAGYQPIGAVMVADHVYQAVQDGSGLFQHGHTYLGHPTACAAAFAVQKVIEEDGLLGRVREMGDYLNNALHERFGNHRHVGDIRGRGLFRAVELVADRGSKTPFDPGQKLHARIKTKAMDRGLICYPGGGTIDGRLGDHVLLAPPFIVETGQIDEIVERLGDAVDAALDEALSG
ncbi:MAG: aspartate aminotransferase family protein [Pseudomonadota bacterium]